MLQCTIHVTTAAPIKLSDPYDIEIGNVDFNVDSFELSATTVDEITTST